MAFALSSCCWSSRSGLGWYALARIEEASRSATRSRRRSSPACEADKIDQVTIKSEKGERTTAQKQAGKWQITQPVATAGRRRRALRHRHEPGLARGPARRRRAGVRLQAVRSRPAARRGHVQGRRQGAHAADRAEDADRHRPLRAAAGQAARLSRSRRIWKRASIESTFDLRDKTVLKIDRDKVDNVSIATPDRTLSFAKSGSDWRMTAPVDARADFGAIEGIVGRLNTAQMKALTSPDGGDLKEYGLDKPDDHGARRIGKLAGRSGGWQDARAKGSSTRKTCPGRWSSRSSRPSPTS